MTYEQFEEYLTDIKHYAECTQLSHEIRDYDVNYKACLLRSYLCDLVRNLTAQLGDVKFEHFGQTILNFEDKDIKQFDLTVVDRRELEIWLKEVE